jgi:hypothetical protein
MCTYLSLVTVTSLNFTTWTLTGLLADLFAGIALFADGARSPAASFDAGKPLYAADPADTLARSRSARNWKGQEPTRGVAKWRDGAISEEYIWA